jgi:hypothetical protein
VTTDLDQTAPQSGEPAPWRVPTRVVRRQSAADAAPADSSSAVHQTVSALDPCFEHAGDLIGRTPVYPRPPMVDWATGRPLEHTGPAPDRGNSTVPPAVPWSVPPTGSALPPPGAVPGAATPVAPGRSPVPPPPPVPPGVTSGVPASAAAPLRKGAPAVIGPADPQMAHLLGRMGDDVVAGVAAMNAASGHVAPTDVRRPAGERAAYFDVGAGLAFRPTFASLGARVAAWLVDVASIGAMTAPGWYLIGRFDGVLRIAGIVVVVLAVIAAARSYTLAVATTGAWIGNRVTQTGVVDARNGHLLTTGAAATRFVLRFTVSLVLFFGYLPAITGRQRRTFHDSFAGSIVVGRARQVWHSGDA